MLLLIVAVLWVRAWMLLDKIALLISVSKC